MSDPMGPVHTAGNAVPPIDPELAGVIEDTTGVHAGIDLITQGIELLALDRLTTDRTQTVLATLAGSEGADIITALALLVARLADSDSNPSLRGLPHPTQRTVRQLGEQHAYLTAATAPRAAVADAIGHIDTPNDPAPTATCQHCGADNPTDFTTCGYCHHRRDWYPATSDLAEGGCPAMTEDEKKELSKKLAKKNDDTAKRPR
ncbi:hypothetical protein [Streptomyces sp. NPDC060366]|uniref:hypothetical protein n=1 Tax=Streptomyces sp. NPDC060366 TaxID=3347105 RepID=UPI003658BEFF